MEKLIRERKSLEPRLKRVHDTVVKIQPEAAEEIDVQSELDTLNDIWAAYCSVHKRILDACTNDETYEEAIECQCRFEEAYVRLKNRLLKLLKVIKLADSNREERPPSQNDVITQLAQQQAELLNMMSTRMVLATSSTAASPEAAIAPTPLSDLKLPPMTLPVFSGNYLEWQSFIDLFNSMVHQNPSLKDSQKLYFLKTNLSGEAASLISHLKIEDVNYSPALQKLKSRYDKPLEIAHKHIERFLSQPALTSSSADGLRSLHDISDEVVRALQAMQREDRDTWLLFILIEKLDRETKQLWYQRVADMQEANITLQCFLHFIDSRSFALQSAQPPKHGAVAAQKPPVKPSYRGATAFITTNAPPVCNVCAKSPHPLYQCGKFIHMSPEERLSTVSRQRLCKNCLKQHLGEVCRSGNCRKCGLLHHTLLHAAFEPSDHQPSPFTSYAVHANNGPAAQSLISALDPTANLDASNVLLATVAINVLDKYGRPHACRAVLDSASQVSFISKSFCDELGLDLMEADMDLEGISSMPAHADKCAQIVIASRCTDYRTAVPCMVLEEIVKTLPAKPADIDQWSIPDSIELADPLFNRPGKISVLLGIELFFQLLEPGKINLSTDDSLPTLQNTKLGWVVAGRYRNSAPLSNLKVSTCLLASSDDGLCQQLRKFWEIEEYAVPKIHISEEERRCEEHFSMHTVRNNSGKFTVRLPFLHPPSQLGDSRQMAVRRLEHMERKLHRNPLLKQEYHAFLREYLELGHMTISEHANPTEAVYLPHHCVIKEASSTTKCRVVFDASAKTTSGKSLNDILMAGPVLQDSLVNILLRFRIPTIVITGDIKQMYRMIEVHQDDRDFQRILWRWSSDEPVKEYRLNTVTYGTKSASYLATKCVQQLLESHRLMYTEAVEKAERGTYVDDILTGADSEEEAILLRQQLSTILASGGFHLRKWASNSVEVLNAIPAADREINTTIELNNTRTIKALGIYWQPCSDEFLFSNIPNQIFQPTKRTMLSQIASIFDPLGLLAPIVIKAKMVMQQLWELKVDWDEAPPGELVQVWLTFVQSLSDLNSLQVPRRVIGTQAASRLYLHGFSDASERAMGACVYIRAIDNDGNTSSHLLCAKSKLAPIGNGRTTLPRLELCAAVILSRLIANVKEALTIPFHEIRAYSDSTVALAWIAGGASRWKTFVANRVAEITTHLPAVNWNHIDTRSNPADLISRGTLPEQTINSALWWHGPYWNACPNIDNSAPTVALDDKQQRQVEREQRSAAVTYLVVYENDFLDGMLARYYPKLQHLLRITAWMIRFRHREYRAATLTAYEIDNAMQLYVKHVQRLQFAKEINQLEKHHEVHHTSPLRQLKPFLDEAHLLRVGGRLQLSDLSYDTKHPILLPHRSIFTALVLHHEHNQLFHCGPQSLLAAVRKRFWIISGTSAARKTCRSCVECVRAKPVPIHQLMGQLPADRLKPVPPFSITGVDYAGPINVVSRRTRGAVATKGYIALFVCFSTRAVHLEAVSDLTTSAFIAAFTRFSCRYGLPNKMYSDNATNLRGAARKLRELYQQINLIEHENQIADYFADEGIEWSFIPARSPHHGGLWEAGVKVAKSLLNKLGGDSRFTFEELSTVLSQVAACMNSRPITPLSNDPNEPQPLTPAHFLIGRTLNAVPEINQLERQIGSLNRWQYVQRVTQEFRVRWQNEYVLLLQRMVKWQHTTPNVTVGEFVLLIADNEKAKQWPIGRVVDTFPGPDGRIRVVAVKTTNGISRRDVRRIRRIPLEDDEYVPGRNGAEIPRSNLVGGLCYGGSKSKRRSRKSA
ncbi:uncharacterized protein LOC131687146 [Topomyia yanbarensis]|uniref:uncharacterized protein LOC131687146 n=1 Tax=Topomyia yanbarensis TaxID=2498891 RepID=UPI00273CC345|nr:uncharacterized protein LOC131687146 [Topomyia yanbarensis]